MTRLPTERVKSKDRLLFILQHLIHNTDDEHRISQQELADLCAETGHGTDRHVISRDIDVLCEYGFDVIRTREGRKNYYHYGCRELDIAELRTLMDAVESSVFISPRKTECLMQKIAGLSSCHEAEKLCTSVYTGKVAKSENHQIFLTIDVINQAINEKKKISFQHYTFDGNRNRVMRHGGEVYTVSPYMTIWKDDRYYLVGWADNRESIRTFRIDRMAIPKLLNAGAVPRPEDFDPQYYYGTLTKMYGTGPEMDVILRCDDSLMSNMIDRFGEDFSFQRSDQNHFRATVHVNASDTFWGWVFEYVGRMRVEGPEEARQMYRERLMRALEDCE